MLKQAILLRLVLLICRLLFKSYGYEGLNLLFRFMPMTLIPIVLEKYGATIGQNVRIKSPVTFNDAEHGRSPFYNLVIGDGTFIGRNCLIDLRDRVFIGEKVTLSHQVSLLTHTDAGNSPLSDHVITSSHAPVTIGNGAYIGVGAIILQGVEIGEKAVIGAAALVNKDIPANYVAVGIPAKPIHLHTT